MDFIWVGNAAKKSIEFNKLKKLSRWIPPDPWKPERIECEVVICDDKSKTIEGEGERE